MNIGPNPERGQRIRAERTRLGLSQTAFAALAGQGKHSQILYEKVGRTPAADYLAAIHAAGADILFIVTGERPAPVDEGFLDAEEAERHAAARKAWIQSEARAIQEFRKGNSERGCDVGIESSPLAGESGRDAPDAFEDVPAERRVIRTKPGDQTDQDQFKNTSVSSRVFQNLRLFFVHLTHPGCRCAKATGQTDSVKGKTHPSRSKEAA